MEKYNVVIKDFANNETVEFITKVPVNKRIADRIERGANINLNHNEYYTELTIAE